MFYAVSTIFFFLKLNLSLGDDHREGLGNFLLHPHIDNDGETANFKVITYYLSLRVLTSDEPLFVSKVTKWFLCYIVPDFRYGRSSLERLIVIFL